MSTPRKGRHHMSTPESEKSLLKLAGELLFGVYVLFVIVMTLVAGVGVVFRIARWAWGITG